MEKYNAIKEFGVRIDIQTQNESDRDNLKNTKKINNNNCGKCKYFDICHGGCKIFDINSKDCISLST